jgi:hypothetical protein
MMRFFTACVRNGRLTLDEPSDLAEGTLLELVATEDVLSDRGNLLHVVNEEELAALDRELDASFEEEASGQLIDTEDAIADLKPLRDESLSRLPPPHR